MGQELNGKFPEIKALAKIMDFKNYLGLGVGAIVGVGWVVVAGDWLVRGGPRGAILGFIIGELLLIFVGLITVISPFLGKSSVLPMVNVGSFAFISD